MVTLVARFRVTHGYIKSQKRYVTFRFQGNARNRVTGPADPSYGPLVTQATRAERKAFRIFVKLRFRAK